MQKFESELLEKKRLTYDTQSFFFSVPSDFDFISGQFVMLSSDNILDENGKLIKRAYSIASAPNNSKIELCIKVSSEFGLSKRIQDSVIGDKFNVQGPLGKFGPHENDFTDKVMIVAGSGITPAMSIIRNTDYVNLSGTHYLFYVNKTKNDIIYEQELNELKCKNLKIINFLTRDEDGEASFHGRVTIQHLIDELDSLENKSFFICGPIELVREINHGLMDRGVSKEVIHKEAWNT